MTVERALWLGVGLGALACGYNIFEFVRLGDMLNQQQAAWLEIPVLIYVMIILPVSAGLWWTREKKGLKHIAELRAEIERLKQARDNA